MDTGLLSLLWNVFTVIVGLAVVYFGHEFGHLLAARACRVKLTKYYFTFDKATDPRNFAARPVWQRMIVISAGAVMNLILAVVFAAVAYYMGVSYIPCILGGTAPGDPAWLRGVQPGDKIVQIGRNGDTGREGKPDEHLRFDKDMMIAVTLNGADGNIDLLIRHPGQNQAEWMSFLPSDRLKDFGRPATLGVRPASTTKLNPVEPCDPDCRDEEGYSLLRGGDEIVALDGLRLPRDETTGAIFEYHLEKHLASRMTEPVTLTVLRRSESERARETEPSATRPKELDVTLPPNSLRTVGLIMEMGPIVGVRRGTPAEEAGFQVGDILRSVNGQPVGDPFTLAQRLLPDVGEEVAFAVQRPSLDEPVTLLATLVPPATYVDNFGPGSPATLECLGIAFEVRNVVKEVEPDSSADAQGLCPGDKIDSVQFLLGGELSEDPIPLVGWGPNGEEIDLPNWAHVHTVMNLLEDSTLRLTYERNDAIYEVVLTPEDSDRWYHPSRRLNTTSLTLVQTADSWLEAGRLGVRETQLYMEQVLTVLQRLFTVRISYKTMGGPIAITSAASSEASHGMARFFLFLAFLSVNLAFLSLLPIPPLDGGHVLFLAIEWLRGKPVSRNVQVPFIVVSHVVFILLACMLLVPCMSQLLRLIGLIRMRKQADKGVKVINDFAEQE